MRSTLARNPTDANASARRRLLSRRGEPLFVADWDRVLFVHYEVDRAALQREVPFPLDLREGRAYVSLVAFTLRGLRLRGGGLPGAWMCRPFATHQFLNLRAYVVQRGEPGIYFLREWLSNRFSVLLGPITFGLPYRFARIRYEHDHETGKLRGEVRPAPRGEGVRYEGTTAVGGNWIPCAEGSLDDFLLERYTAYTSEGSALRFFRVWHEPWLQLPARVSLQDENLVARDHPWFSQAECVHANYSPGVRGVWMGRPYRIRPEDLPKRKRPLSAFFEMP